MGNSWGGGIGDEPGPRDEVTGGDVALQSHSPRAAPGPSAAPQGRVHLDESVARPVVCDGEAKRVLRLGHLHLLRLTPDMGEDEVLQADLSPQQLLHVYFVRVERAKEDLPWGTPSVGAGDTPAGQGAPVVPGQEPAMGRPGWVWVLLEQKGLGHPVLVHPSAPFPQLQATQQLPSARGQAAATPCPRAGGKLRHGTPPQPFHRGDETALRLKCPFSGHLGGLRSHAARDPREDWPRQCRGVCIPALGAKPPPHTPVAAAPSPQWERCQRPRRF